MCYGLCIFILMNVLQAVEKNVYYAVVGWTAVFMWIEPVQVSYWFSVWWVCHLLRGGFGVPTVVVDFCFSFQFCWFCFVYFEDYLIIYTWRIVRSLWWIALLIVIQYPLSVVIVFVLKSTLWNINVTILPFNQVSIENNTCTGLGIISFHNRIIVLLLRKDNFFAWDRRSHPPSPRMALLHFIPCGVFFSVFCICFSSSLFPS